MPFLTKDEMRARGSRILSREQQFGKTARSIFAEATEFDIDQAYDVFLSHSSLDKLLVLGVKSRLEAFGLNVYVDWIDDAELDRAAVTPDNARRLKRRMKHCRGLLYLATGNAAGSKWMPWEVGYFDGLDRGPIGILPVLDSPYERFVGVEFLGLYPLVRVEETKGGYDALFYADEYGKLVNFRKALNETE